MLSFLADTADRAGYNTTVVDYEDVVERDGVLFTADGERVLYVYKTLPTETLEASEWKGALLTTRWVEPPWRVVPSTKFILAALWEMFPGHPHLLPAFWTAEGARGFLAAEGWFKKHPFGRQGEGVDFSARPDSDDGSDDGCVWQAYGGTPAIDGKNLVVGCWMVGDEPVAFRVREDDGFVTQDDAAVVPHVIGSFFHIEHRGHHGGHTSDEQHIYEERRRRRGGQKRGRQKGKGRGKG